MEKIDYSTFARNIRCLRTMKGLTANELSKAAGFKAAKRVSDFEYSHNGQRRGVPSLEEVHALSKVLEVTIDDLLFKEAIVTVTFNKFDQSTPTDHLGN